MAKGKGRKKETLSINYKATTYIGSTNLSVDMTKLQYNMIMYEHPTKVEIQGVEFEIDSWVQLILMLIDIIEKRKGINFINTLNEAGINNAEFSVSFNYGKYASDETVRAYKLNDTKYYVEFVNRYDIIFDTIVKCMNILKIKLPEMIINLERNLESDTLDDIEVTNILDIDDCVNKMNSNCKLISISFEDKYIPVHTIQEILINFCNYMGLLFGNNAIRKFRGLENTYICNNKGVKINFTDYYICSNLDVREVLTFVKENRYLDTKLYFKKV